MQLQLQEFLNLYSLSQFGNDALWMWFFSISTFGFLMYYILVFSRLLFYKDKTTEIEIEPVSVIIASRDDANFLRRHLPLIMNQKDVDFEVIVVDDCSMDDTIDVLREYSEQYSNFRHTKLIENGEFEGGKKYAVTLGIKAAKNGHLVLIDADCYPNSEFWLKRMAARLMYKKVVLGYGPYKREKGILNKVIRFDTYKIALQYLSFSLAGIPYMGVGRNMAYHSYLYFDSKGFTTHLNVVSGDDDLFVNEVSNSKNTGIEIHPDSHVFSIAKPTYAKWEYQKRRHLTTAPKYKWNHKLLLMGLPILQYGMIFSLIWLATQGIGGVYIWLIFGSKVLLQGAIQFFAMKKLQVLDLFVWSIVLEPILMLFYPWVTFLNIVNEDQRKRWI